MLIKTQYHGEPGDVGTSEWIYLALESAGIEVLNFIVAHNPQTRETSARYNTGKCEGRSSSEIENILSELHLDRVEVLA